MTYSRTASSHPHADQARDRFCTSTAVGRYGDPDVVDPTVHLTDSGLDPNHSEERWDQGPHASRPSRARPT